MNIVLVTLVNNQTLLGDWCEEESILKKAVYFSPVDGGLALTPPNMLCEGIEDLKLQPQHIVYTTTPNADLKNKYNEQFGSGLVMPKKGGLIV